LTSTTLVIDTELIRYRWTGADGNFPEYEKLIPAESNTSAHFDTVEAIKAVNSLRALDGKGSSIDLDIGSGKITMADTDGKGQGELVADTEGELKIRVDAQYILEALRACGGMAELKLTDSKSPMLFATSGYQLVVMPMLVAKPHSEAEAVAEAEAEPETTDTEPEAEAKAQSQKRASSCSLRTLVTQKKPTH